VTTAHERPAALAEDARPRLADRLGTVRTRYFVGRAAELDLFRACLQADERPWALLYVHGPGGVGKSVLLRGFGRVAQAAGASVALLDGRDLEPSPAGFLRGLRQALGLDERAAPVDVLAGAARPVLLIDTYEQLAPLDAWLREELLPQLPSQALIVMAGRTPPSPAWRADPAWSELGRVIALRNLLPEDSRAYLSARGVPPEQHAAVLEFTHGHPLALSLLANLLLYGGGQRAASFRPEHAPDVVRVLLERFIEHVPSRLHWRALAVCAHARVTTEALLADVLGAEAAPALFDWLRELPFVEHGPLGIFPHDLAREVLDADLRWRDPPTYADLHARIRDAVVARLESSRGLERQDAYFDLIYLVRHSSVSKAYYDWASFGHLYAEPATPADVDEIVAMVHRHEGDASARIAEYWLGRQRSAFVVFREPGRRLAGFAAALLLERESPEDRAADPAVAAAWDFVARHGPLRPGEALMHHRFFVGREGYQDTATHNMVAMVATMRWLTTPRLAWCFAAVAEPERWRPMFEAIRFPRSPEADFEVGGRRYGVFTHDWRVDPPAVWVQAKVALEPPNEPARALGQDGAAPLLVLSEPDFAAAVRRALRDYHRPELARNPLLRSRLALANAGGAPTVATLQALMREAAEELRGHPRHEKLYRALALTYLEPLATQEAAAERLGLPFNTYRYQLAAAVTRVTARLWQRELGADAG
jgi:hypothetical protein